MFHCFKVHAQSTHTLSIREIVDRWIKNSQRYYTKGNTKLPTASKVVEKRTFITFLVRIQTAKASLESTLVIIINKNCTYPWPQQYISGNLSYRCKSMSRKGYLYRMFSGAFLLVVKKLQATQMSINVLIKG